MALWRKVLFVSYAVISYIYRWVITFVILVFLDSFLKPYKLGVISRLLALAAVGSMIGWPLYRLGKNLHQRGRLPDMKRWRVTVSAVVVAAVLLFLLFVPLPVSRVRQTALVEFQPDATVKVFVHESGILEKLAVQEGQWVKEGQALAYFSDPELDNQLRTLETEYKIRMQAAKALERKLDDAQERQEKDRIERERVQLLSEADQYRTERDALLEKKQALVLRAPRAGVVIGLPKRDEIRKFYDKEQRTPFCEIGEPERLRALVPVTPADYELLKSDREYLQQRGADLEATIRVQGHGGSTWRGKLAPLPLSECKDMPVELTTRGGGPVAVKPGPPEGPNVPQAQLYLISVDFVDFDRSIYPRTMAQVKIHCRWRSCAWWAWRTLNNMFDLGLM
jgi:putative peptide zinc metalloprotease protein